MKTIILQIQEAQKTPNYEANYAGAYSPETGRY